MNMHMLSHHIRQLAAELKELEVVYGYMVQNAPTEEARRIVELNRMTVTKTLVVLGETYHQMNGEMIPMGEVFEEVPVFTSFMEAARYGFNEETQVIHLLKNLLIMCDSTYYNNIFGSLVEHQLNAMRLLFLMS